MSLSSVVKTHTRLAADHPSVVRSVILIAAAVMLCAACWRVAASFGSMMWLDELYTTTLIAAPSLGHLWDGALRGVDGNPPLYLSLAWLVTSAVPADPERVLRTLNLFALAATAALVYRLGRRVANPLSVVAALATLPALDGLVEYSLLEVRTYALYLLLVTATLSATLGVVDRPTSGRTVLLAGVGILATLAPQLRRFLRPCDPRGGRPRLSRRPRPQGCGGPGRRGRPGRHHARRLDRGGAPRPEDRRHPLRLDPPARPGGATRRPDRVPPADACPDDRPPLRRGAHGPRPPQDAGTPRRRGALRRAGRLCGADRRRLARLAGDHAVLRAALLHPQPADHSPVAHPGRGDPSVVASARSWRGVRPCPAP